MLLLLRKRPVRLILSSILLVVALEPAAHGGALQPQTVAEITGNSKIKSHEDRDFLVYSSTKVPNSTYRFLIQSGLHGNERLPVEFVNWLKERYARGQSLLNRLPRDSDLDFLPIASPDGYAANIRENGNGVNLNRNFSVLWGVSREVNGKMAFSEPESRAVRDLLQKRNYTAVVDVHGYSNWVVLPSEPALLSKVDTRMKSIYRRWTSEITDIMERFLPGYELKTAGGLGDGGAFEDYAFWQTNSLSLCLEMKSSKREIPSLNPSLLVGLTQKKYSAVTEEDTFLTYELVIFRAFSKAILIKSSQSQVLVTSSGNSGNSGDMLRN